jgi:hypothetical protein
VTIARTNIIHYFSTFFCSVSLPKNKPSYFIPRIFAKYLEEPRPGIQSKSPNTSSAKRGRWKSLCITWYEPCDGKWDCVSGLCGDIPKTSYANFRSPRPIRDLDNSFPFEPMLYLPWRLPPPRDDNLTSLSTQCFWMSWCLSEPENSRESCFTFSALLSVIIFAIVFFMCACEFFDTQINLMDGDPSVPTFLEEWIYKDVRR